MHDAELLAKAFERNRRIVQAQCESLTHEDSLLQTPYNINCLNWVVGHILDGRSRLLEVLDEEPVLPPERTARYRRESDPVTADGPEVIRLDEMMVALDESQERLAAALARLGPDDLERQVEVGDHAEPLGWRLHFAYFHDTYHTGQTDLLRQVAGTDDRII
jgi:hypothetical protein